MFAGTFLYRIAGLNISSLDLSERILELKTAFPNFTKSSAFESIPCDGAL